MIREINEENNWLADNRVKNDQIHLETVRQSFDDHRCQMNWVADRQDQKVETTGFLSWKKNNNRHFFFRRGNRFTQRFSSENADAENRRDDSDEKNQSSAVTNENDVEQSTTTENIVEILSGALIFRRRKHFCSVRREKNVESTGEDFPLCGKFPREILSNVFYLREEKSIRSKPRSALFLVKKIFSQLFSCRTSLSQHFIRLDFTLERHENTFPPREKFDE